MSGEDDNLPSFDDPRLATRVEALDLYEIDLLPFGVVHLDVNGHVDLYNATERERSGSAGLPRIGRDFFARVAPCFDTDDFRGRITRARANGKLDIEFSHIGEIDGEDRQITVRIQAAADGGCWIFILWDED